jgi:hypothetical protein
VGNGFEFFGDSHNDGDNFDHPPYNEFDDQTLIAPGGRRMRPGA